MIYIDNLNDRFWHKAACGVEQIRVLAGLVVKRLLSTQSGWSCVIEMNVLAVRRFMTIKFARTCRCLFFYTFSCGTLRIITIFLINNSISITVLNLHPFTYGVLAA